MYINGVEARTKYTHYSKGTLFMKGSEKTNKKIIKARWLNFIPFIIYSVSISNDFFASFIPKIHLSYMDTLFD